MKLRPERESSTELREALQYWSREDAGNCDDTPPLDSVAESAVSFTRRAGALALTADAWTAEPLDQWKRLRVMATLLDGYTDSNRESKCQRTRFKRDAPVGIRRSSSGKWSTRNTIQCGKMTCPVCGVRRARRVASQIGACMERHREGIECDVWMLTLAPPHAADVPTETTIDRLYEAAAHFFRSTAWRRFEREHDICARVRVLDATHGGANGCHPHFHIALFPRWAYAIPTWRPDPDELRWFQRKREQERANGADSFVRALIAWKEGGEVDTRPTLIDYYQPLRTHDHAYRSAWLAHIAREDLLEAWRVSCEKVGIAITDRAAFKRRALALSPAEDAAAYFTKWGLADEVASSPQKHRSHLRLLDLVEAGHDRAGDIYRDFRRAVEGKQWVSGMGDAMKELGVHDEDAAAWLERLTKKREDMLEKAGTPVPDLLPLELVIPGYLYPAALRVGWECVFALCDAEAEHASNVIDVQLALDRFLWSQLGSQAPPFPEEQPCFS